MRVSKVPVIVLVALLGGLMLGVLTPGPALARSQHALPTIYSPTPNAVLKVPPAQVMIRFSEHLDPDISKIVVNPSNQAADNHDNAISDDDYAMTVTLLGRILFQSRFGGFLVARIGLSLVGIICLNVPSLRMSLTTRNLRWVLPLFGVLLAVVFAYSGHNGTATVWWGPIVDLFHLLANGIWLGGLFTLALFILSALRARNTSEHAAHLSASIPAFSVPALVAATTLAITGPLNADARMTAFSQLWTTGYGIVLTIKIGLFLVMVLISYEHAFRLLPQLTAMVDATASAGQAVPASPQVSLVRWLEQEMNAFEQWQAPTTATTLAVAGTTNGPSPTHSERATTLTWSIMRWLRVEAMIGTGLLLGAMLLSPLLRTLAPMLSESTSFSATGGSQHFTQMADTLKLSLTVAPGHFGTNTFTVVVTNPDGSPASGDSVELITDMVEMDMGVVEVVHATPNIVAGMYDAQVTPVMVGEWHLTATIHRAEEPSARVGFDVPVHG